MNSSIKVNPSILFNLFSKWMGFFYIHLEKAVLDTNRHDQDNA